MSDARELADWHESCALMQGALAQIWNHEGALNTYYSKSASKHRATAALLRAQPSAEPPAPPREAGLIAEINRALDREPFPSASELTGYLIRARDRLAALQSELAQAKQECSNHAWQESEQCKRAERAEAELAQATARAEIPREPTEAMMQAAYEDWNNHNGGGKSRSAAEAMRARWRAMYDAALASGTGAG